MWSKGPARMLLCWQLVRLKAGHSTAREKQLQPTRWDRLPPSEPHLHISLNSSWVLCRKHDSLACFGAWRWKLPSTAKHKDPASKLGSQPAPPVHRCCPSHAHASLQMTSGLHEHLSLNVCALNSTPGGREGDHHEFRALE